LPEDEVVLAADRRQAARVLAERARAASEVFRKKGADWDEMRALGLPAAAVEDAILDLLPTSRIERLLDIGTGTGQLLEFLAPRIGNGLGIDASRSMLALARTRLAKPGLAHVAVRLGDMYRMPLADAAFDVVVLQMVLHYAEDPIAAVAEAARVLRPGGLAIIVDLAAHDSRDVIDRLAHRWPGFSDERLDDLLTRAGLASVRSAAVPGPFEVRLWSAASAVSAAPSDLMMEETP
jgi:ArsR family transcriptional regulator